MVSDSPVLPLSVVIVTVHSPNYLEPCLSALGEQIQAPEDLEMIVVFNQDDERIRVLKEWFPKVQFHHLPGRQTQNTLRSFGVKKARGRIVAVTVDHCTPDKHWCHRLLTAHKWPHAGIGGAIEKGTQPDTLVNWAVHLYDYCNYGFYLKPPRGGPAADLSDCNISYKRDILIAEADLWAEDFNVSLFNRALLKRGQVLWLSPEITVRQNRDISFEHAAKVAYRRGRAFASARLAKASDAQRVGRAVLSPFLPIILLSRFLRNIYEKKEFYGIAMRALPLISIFVFLWSWGELLIQLLGKRDVTVAIMEE